MKEPRCFRYFVGLSILFYSCLGFSQIPSNSNPIADLLDSLYSERIAMLEFSKPLMPKNARTISEFDTITKDDETLFTSRLAKLDAESPFDLVYNNYVKNFINLYAYRKRDAVSRMMGISQLYYPMFEEVFDRYQLPVELKHLAVIESALIPYARSRVGATGLWQFMYPTGKHLGLRINSYIDERCDPYKSTVAATQYLKYLYDIFKDWQMVLAAYNAGPGTISRAIRRSGGKKTYWEIRPYLPQETQSYVPAFIAANYIMNHAADHGIYPSVPRKNYLQVDTVVVKQEMTFDQLSQVLDVSVEELEYFNPQYRKQIIPNGGHPLCLSNQKIAQFISNETEIYTFFQTNKSSIDSANVNAPIESTQNANKTTKHKSKSRIFHVVKRGETWAMIAKRYNVSVSKLKSWNYVGKKGLQNGKRLIIYKS